MKRILDKSISRTESLAYPRESVYRLLVLLGFLTIVSASTVFADTVTGTIRDRSGQIKNATVRIQGTQLTSITDDAGKFSISALESSVPVTVTAWKDGYYSVMRERIVPPATDININLTNHQLHDYPGYKWIPPSGNHPSSCDKCHDKALMEMCLDDAHMKSATNLRFLTVYYGQDMLGNRTASRSYKKGTGAWSTLPVPESYGIGDKYHGPGFATEKTGTAGNCSSCHLPGASVEHNILPENLIGADREKSEAFASSASGIHCDFCHKVADIKFNRTTKMPFPGLTGVHAMEVLRPDGIKRGSHEQLFFGPFDDPYSVTSTKLPLISQSQFCAPCHHGVFWSQPVYNSYVEWLKSPYAKEGSPQFKTCQQCHMPSPVTWKGRTMTSTAPGKGGIERDPSSFRSHRMTIDAEILSNALTMTANARKESGKVLVDVELYNDKTGHHVPSDSPLRHLILYVEVKERNGNTLKQLSGPVLPDWTGSSGKVDAVPAFSGKAGKAYAKLLKEKWTNEFPTASYWNDFDIVSDNRLAAFARDASSYGFEHTGTGEVQVTVSLYYRRAYYQIMEWKKWTDADILMARKEFAVN